MFPFREAVLELFAHKAPQQVGLHSPWERNRQTMQALLDSRLLQAVVHDNIGLLAALRRHLSQREAWHTNSDALRDSWTRALSKVGQKQVLGIQMKRLKLKASTFKNQGRPVGDQFCYPALHVLEATAAVILGTSPVSLAAWYFACSCMRCKQCCALSPVHMISACVPSKIS